LSAAASARALVAQKSYLRALFRRGHVALEPVDDAPVVLDGIGCVSAAMARAGHVPDLDRPFGQGCHALDFSERDIRIVRAVDKQDRARSDMDRPQNRIGLIDTALGAQRSNDEHRTGILPRQRIRDAAPRTQRVSVFLSRAKLLSATTVQTRSESAAVIRETAAPMLKPSTPTLSMPSLSAR